MRLCELLRGGARQPVNMALAFRALMLDNVLEFVYGEIPPTLQGLKDLSFSSEYLSTTYQWMDWSATWPRRNFPRLFSMVVSLLPKRVHEILLPGDYVMSKFFEVRMKLSTHSCRTCTFTDCRDFFRSQVKPLVND